MAKVEMKGQDNRIFSFAEFEELLKSVEMGWYGLNNWTRGDLDLFEELFDGFTCEPSKCGGMKVWDRNFDYSNLY